MKKIILVLALLFAPTLAWGQCNGVYTAGQVCGSVLGGAPGPVNLSQAINPVIYGADPTGVADSAPALTAACAASNYVLFPPGTFTMLSKVTCTTLNSAPGIGHPKMTIQGSGSQATRLNFSNTTDGIEIDYSGSGASASVKNISIETNQSPGGVALTLKLALAGAGAAANPTDLRDVILRGNINPITSNGWSTGVSFQNISDIIIDGLFVAGKSVGGSQGTGLIFTGDVGLSSSAVSISIVNSFFITLNIGVQYDALGQGMFITNTNFTTDVTGIFVPSGLAQLTQLNVTTCQINPASVSGAKGIDLESGVSAVSINNSFFILPASTTGVVFNSTAIGGYEMGNNTFAGTSAGVGTGVTFTATSATIGGAIGGNVFESLATGISIAATGDYISIIGNVFNSDTAKISNSSTGAHNQIVSNPGYNPVGVTAAANVCASPCTITAGASPETHYLRQSATNTATVTKGSQAVATLAGATTYYPFELGPNESIIVTWTATNPTDTVDVH